MGGGGGQREGRGATVYKSSFFVHVGNSSQAGSTRALGSQGKRELWWKHLGQVVFVKDSDNKCVQYWVL